MKNNSILHHGIGIIKTPINTSTYWYLTFLNILSNCAIVFFINDWLAFISIISLGFFTAYLESTIYHVLKYKIFRYIYLTIVILTYNVLIATEYFNVYNFQTTYSTEILQVITETDAIEISNFIKTYLHPQTLFFYFAIILLCNFLFYRLGIWIFKRQYTISALLFTFVGCCIVGIFLYNRVLFHNGLQITNYQSLTRTGYALFGWYKRYNLIATIRNNCKMVKSHKKFLNSPDIILIIGESASIYHSQLYGYEKPTTPLLSKLKENGELFVFNNVISAGDATSKAMYSIYPLHTIEDSPLFPACFRSAGYHTMMFNNQYFVGRGMNFLSDKEVSSILFDYRNTKRYSFDLDLVNTIKLVPSPTLYIIHLWGQHYTYSERYPKEFKSFSENEYDRKKWNKEQRSIIASYDNATLYNDYVINNIINKFRDKNCCIIYFADHREEV